MLTRQGLGNEVLAGTTVVDTASGQDRPPPPLDELFVDWSAGLPPVRAAGRLVVQQVLTGSPFGAVTTRLVLDGGRIGDLALGRSDTPPDVLVVRRYGRALAERRGALDLLDSLEGGRLVGDRRAVRTFLAAYGSDECRAARRRLTTPSCRPLAVLGELLSSQRWHTLMAPAAGALARMASTPRVPPLPAEGEGGRVIPFPGSGKTVRALPRTALT